jgi:hypothetical protein
VHFSPLAEVILESGGTEFAFQDVCYQILVRRIRELLLVITVLSTSPAETYVSAARIALLEMYVLFKKTPQFAHLAFSKEPNFQDLIAELVKEKISSTSIVRLLVGPDMHDSDATESARSTGMKIMDNGAQT